VNQYMVPWPSRFHMICIDGERRAHVSWVFVNQGTLCEILSGGTYTYGLAVFNPADPEYSCEAGMRVSARDALSKSTAPKWRKELYAAIRKEIWKHSPDVKVG